MFYILLGVLLGLFIYYKIIKPAHYWEDRNVVHEPGLPIVGNMGKAVLKKKHIMDLEIELYKKYPGQRYVGYLQFTLPMLMIRDVDLIKQVGVKEFDHFHDHMPVFRRDDDILMSRSLISLDGSEWRQMRATLSPAFTSSKMRTMYQLMYECAENFVSHFKRKEQVAVEMKDIFARFTTDVIATTAFGVPVNSLDEPKNEFFMMSKRLNRGIFKIAQVMILSKFPTLAKYVGTPFFPADVTNFFRSVVKDNIAKRQKDGIIRPDLIHLLMQVRKGQLKHESEVVQNEGFATVEESQIGKSTKQVNLTDDDIVAQAMIFFFAGFDTVSTGACFMAHELAVHPDIQEKLQEEIDELCEKYNGKVPYEALLSMKYLDQVVSETLRLWTPAFRTDRICTKDFVIPPKNPGEREIVIQKGDAIAIPIAGIHRDPKYYPEPEKFDPERFNDENKSKIVPGSYLPFGVGPRNCIGSRFALLELKTLFYHLLTKFDIVPVNGTQIPLRLSPSGFNLNARDGFRLGFRPRKVK